MATTGLKIASFLFSLRHVGLTKTQKDTLYYSGEDYAKRVHAAHEKCLRRGFHTWSEFGMIKGNRWEQVCTQCFTRAYPLLHRETHPAFGTDSKSLNLWPEEYETLLGHYSGKESLPC